MAPNGVGSHPEEVKRLDTIFVKIASSVKKFSKNHHLLISKYYHDSTSWDLMFRRKMGGTGMIQIVLTKPDVSVFDPNFDTVISTLPNEFEFSVSATFWMDDYEKLIRKSRNERIGFFVSESGPQEKLVVLLETAFEKILSWKISDLTISSGPHQWKNVWKTKAEFEKANTSALINGKVVPLLLV